jgi:hypothetical protein
MTIHRISDKPPRRVAVPVAPPEPKPLGPVALERRARIEAMKTPVDVPTPCRTCATWLCRKGETEALS